MNHLPGPLDGPHDDPTVPAPPAPPPAAPAAPWPDAEDDDPGDAPAEPGRRLSIGLVVRSLRRHWWQALALWAIGSTVLMAAAYYGVKPTYDAFAQVRVEPGDQSLYTSKVVTPVEFAEFKETQAALVTSPVVLSLALTEHPELFRLPMLQGAEDAEAEIRRALRVSIRPKTNLIDLAMSSHSPVEAAQIVNAVLDAYLKNASNTSNEEIERRIEQLKEARDAKARELDQKRLEWQQLSDKVGAADTEGIKNRNLITTDDYRVWSDQLSQVEIERYAAQTKLEQLRGESLLPGAGSDRAEDLQAMREAFESYPRVAALRQELDRLNARRAAVMRLTRNPYEPARTSLETSIRAIKGELAAWWTRLRPRLERTVAAGPAGAAGDRDRMIREAEVQLAALRSKEDLLRQKLDAMKVKSRDAGGESLRLQFAGHDTQRAAEMLNRVDSMLNQLEHEARSPIARVRKEFPARPSNRPNVNHRTKVMALAPLIVFVLVAGLLVALERRAGRVADPDELSARARVQILGVVPPLPALRPSAAGSPARRDESRARRQLDEFVQSLDHLRVVLCARPDRWGRDRHCVLITSAIGSEGKTTLAAQLAERCVNAGLMTLLIDADLRNPSLSRMFDASEADGLVNVLRGEVEPEGAMTVVGDAGGFHFLPAGSPRTDPSRDLQGEPLGQLLARARESFDMILVDAPPVLPVADALTIGRWTDGVVLAVRYDTSRFGLVERARRRLAGVGIPVLGAVVNGVRAADSSYGGYYAYGGQAAPGSQAAGG